MKHLDVHSKTSLKDAHLHICTHAQTHTSTYTHIHRTPAESVVGCTPGHRRKHTPKQAQLHPSLNKMLSCGSQRGVKRAAKRLPPFLI